MRTIKTNRGMRARRVAEDIDSFKTWEYADHDLRGNPIVAMFADGRGRLYVIAQYDGDRYVAGVGYDPDYGEWSHGRYSFRSPADARKWLAKEYSVKPFEHKAPKANESKCMARMPKRRVRRTSRRTGRIGESLRKAAKRRRLGEDALIGKGLMFDPTGISLVGNAKADADSKAWAEVAAIVSSADVSDAAAVDEALGRVEDALGEKRRGTLAYATAEAFRRLLAGARNLDYFYEYDADSLEVAGAAEFILNSIPDAYDDLADIAERELADGDYASAIAKAAARFFASADASALEDSGPKSGFSEYAEESGLGEVDSVINKYDYESAPTADVSDRIYEGDITDGDIIESVHEYLGSELVDLDADRIDIKVDGSGVVSITGLTARELSAVASGMDGFWDYVEDYYLG